MAQLLLRGTVLGEVRAVLFDKDGTLSISEPQLITLAEARVFLCLQRVPADLQSELRTLLRRAYGLRQDSNEPGGSSICPAGITAVASRDHNLIATATALVQVGLGWPEALSLSEAVFAAADRLDARRALARPSISAWARPSISAWARPSTGPMEGAWSGGLSGESASPLDGPSDGAPGPGSGSALASESSDGWARQTHDAAALESAPPLAGSASGVPLEGPAASAAAASAPGGDGLPCNRDAEPSRARQTGPPLRADHAGRSGCTDGSSSVEGRRHTDGSSETLHLDSAGLPTGGTSHTTEGLRAWLEQLRSASVMCAVISNDDVAGIEHFLASHGLDPYFSAIWSAEHRPRKPDPAAVHGLCEQLGISAADCALIGDANSDLRMAVAAGIPHRLALGYTAAWSTPPPLAEPHPLVHHWRELSLA